MARKPTDKQLFKMKNEWLGQFYEEVKPRDFCRAYKGGNPYQSSFTADTGTYRLCADKVVCKRVYEVERILLN